MSEFVKVAAKSEILPGTAKKVEFEDREVAIFNVKGEFFAIDEMCPHVGGPLSEGIVSGKTVTCTWHGWQFDVSNGDSVSHPGAKVRCYKLKIDGDNILLSS